MLENAEYGNADDIVTSFNAVALDTALKLAGVKHDFIKLSHGLDNDSAAFSMYGKDLHNYVEMYLKITERVTCAFCSGVMMDETLLFRKRMNELADRSCNKNIYTYSDFLTQAQQSELSKLRLNTVCSLYGGYINAERCIAVFGDASDFGYDSSPPVKFVMIEPLQMKFSDRLTHRDFLGSLMGLGIRREMLGDIIVKNNTAYLVCLDTVAEYIIQQLDKVRHTNVKCCLCESVPDDVLPELVYEEHIVASERLDVLISAVFNLSRNESQKKTEAELVFCNSIVVSDSSHVPEKGTIVSVRGLGRFIYDGVIRTTKKGRNVITIRKY